MNGNGYDAWNTIVVDKEKDYGRYIDNFYIMIPYADKVIKSPVDSKTWQKLRVGDEVILLVNTNDAGLKCICTKEDLGI